MSRRALMVGLGEHSEHYLQAATGYFKQRGAAADLASLWLPPGNAPTGSPGEATAIETLPLITQIDTLNTLYYQTETRAWCGPNWKAWQAALASNRLLGKLAMYTHLFAVREKLLSMSATLSPDNRPLNLYLVAHLHDSFASGAFIDLAYLMNHLALPNRWRVYGLLLLPGTPGDPVTAHDETLNEMDVKLRQATTYAALRELQFYLGHESFYDNHNPAYPLSVKGEPPFQTGDCYVLGGERSALPRSRAVDAVEARAPSAMLFNAEQLGHAVAAFVYWQTCTAFANTTADRVSRQGGVSSFGVSQAADLHGQADAMAEKQLKAAFLQTALGMAGQAVELAINWDYWLSPNLFGIDRSALGRAISSMGTLGNIPWLDRRGVQAEAQLETLEMQDQAAVDQTIALEAALNNTAQGVVNDAALAITQAFDGLIQRPEMTIERLRTARQQIDEQINRQMLRLHADLERLEQAMVRAAEAYRLQRRRFMYVSIPYPLAWTVFLPGSIVVGLFGLLLLIPFGMATAFLAWIALGLASAASILYARRAIRLNARREVVEQRRFYLRQQQQFIEKRASAMYLTRLRQRLHETLRRSQDGHYLADYLQTRLQSALDTFTERLPGGVVGALPADADVSALFQRLWQLSLSPTALNPTAIETEVTHAARQYLADRQQTEIAELLKVQLPILREQSVCLLELPGDESQQNGIQHDLVIVQNWDDEQLTPSLRSYLSTNFSLTITHDVSGSAGRAAYVVHLANDISLRALLPMERWRNAYQQMCRVVINDEGHSALYRSLLHPTRIGIASPEILPAQMSRLTFAPVEIMALVMLVHYLNDPQRTPSSDDLGVSEQLAAYLNVPTRPTLSYDELCGALQESPQQAARLRAQVTSRAQHLYPQCATPEMALAALWREVRAYHPRFSERYADWEEWLLGTFDRYEGIR